MRSVWSHPAVSMGSMKIKYVVLCRELNDVVEANEVGFVGLGEVIVGVICPAREEPGEGTNTVRSGGVVLVMKSRPPQSTSTHPMVLNPWA